MNARLDVQLALNTPQFRANKIFTGACRRTLVLAWGRGVGKSWFVRQLWWGLVAKWDNKLREALDPFKGVRIVVLMPTLKQFKDVHLAGILNELEPGGRWDFLGAKIDKQTGAVTFPGGSWVKPVPASEYNSRTARGLRCDLLCADEADDIDRNVYDSVAVPWLSATWSLGLEVIGGTPRRGRHGLLYRQYRDGRYGKRLRLGEEVSGLQPFQIAEFKKIFSLYATFRDVPEIVAAEAVAKAKATTTPSVFAREWECDFDAGEGLVYGGAFDERFHVKKPPANAKWSEILIGCDHGYEDPGVFLLIGVLGSGRDAVCYVLDEVYAQHKTEDWWKLQLKKWLSWYPVAKFYGDPSMPARIEAYRRDCHARVQEVDNSIEDGVAGVADRFIVREVWSEPDPVNGVEAELISRTARLYVSPSCTNLVRELGLYKRRADPKDPDRYTDEIVDRDNHGPDALRYAIFNRFGGPDRRRGGTPAEALG